MGDYCLNELIVHSTNEGQLKEFIEKAKDPLENQVLSFSKLLGNIEALPPLDSEIFDEFEGDIDPFVIFYSTMEQEFFPENNSLEYLYELWSNHWKRPELSFATGKPRISEIGKGYAIYLFRSQDSPPLMSIAYLALMFPDLSFFLKYDQADYRYMGVFEAKGDKFEHNSLDYEGM